MKYLDIVAENIRHYLKLKGYPTVELFAHEFNIPKSTMSRILNGKADPRLSTLVKIAESLNVNIADLYFLPPTLSSKRNSSSNWSKTLKVAEIDGVALYSPRKKAVVSKNSTPKK